MKLFLFLSLCCGSCSFLLSEMQLPSFEEGMRTNRYDVRPKLKIKGRWRLLSKIYERYRAKAPFVYRQKEYRIPKRIHLIWLGSPLPDVCKKMVESWRKYHPTWKVKVWTDADVVRFGPLINQEAYDRSKNWGQKSDILRYEILYRLGGLYVDTDFQALKPFDLLNKTCDFYAGLHHGPIAYMGNALIGAKRHHPVLKECLRSVQVQDERQNFHGILSDTGPECLFRAFLKVIKNKDPGQGIMAPLPVTIVYPLPDYWRTLVTNEKSKEAVEKEWIMPESMAIHYWNISWLK